LVLTASETEHPDLLWALRGGGGNFGVVTSFEFLLHPLGPEIYGAIVVYPAAQAADVVRRWRDFVARPPDEVTCDLLIWGMPPLPGVPPELHWAPVVITAGLYAGSIEAGERAMRPAREFGTPLADMSGPQPYVTMQTSLDPLFPDGQRYYWKSFSGQRLDDDAIAAIAALGNDRPSPRTMLGLRGLGGAMGRVPEEATAYGNRDAFYNLSIDATWQDPAASERIVAWARQAWAALREQAGGGVYVNFAGFGEDNDTLARAGYGHNYERLREVKRRYDPTNLFRGNINIAP
ncbi:MAG TPA: BBE domain-containing protein, partial [Thermomicrobiales bacterium]|nr:BBE domain-containing protein [Thermomicrobiales bacterium]